MHEPDAKNSASIYLSFPVVKTRIEPRRDRPMIQKSAVGLVLLATLAHHLMGRLTMDSNEVKMGFPAQE